MDAAARSPGIARRDPAEPPAATAPGVNPAPRGATIAAMERATALFVARWVLGLKFVHLGWHKCFAWGAGEYTRAMIVEEAATAGSRVPDAVWWTFGYATPTLELVGGALLLLGLRVREAGLALGLALVFTTFRKLQTSPMAGEYPLFTDEFPLAALLLAVLLLPRAWDRWTLDARLGGARPGGNPAA